MSVYRAVCEHGCTDECILCLEASLKESLARERLLLAAITKIKEHVAGESTPNWCGEVAIYRSRGYIADLCEVSNQSLDDTALRDLILKERTRAVDSFKALQTGMGSRSKGTELTAASEIAYNAVGNAWVLGQDYYQQADSDSFKQHAKSDVTRAKYEELLSKTVKDILALEDQ